MGAHEIAILNEHVSNNQNATFIEHLKTLYKEQHWFVK